MPAQKVIELKVHDIKHLMPSEEPPIVGGGIDSDTRDYLYDEADNADRDDSLTWRIVVAKKNLRPEYQAKIAEATRAYFGYQAQKTRRELSGTFRRGRLSLLIAILFIGVTFLFYLAIGNLNDDIKVVANSLFVIGAWVSLWTPLEAFLFDWWPIARKVKVYEKLQTMEVVVVESAN